MKIVENSRYLITFCPFSKNYADLWHKLKQLQPTHQIKNKQSSNSKCPL